MKRKTKFKKVTKTETPLYPAIIFLVLSIIIFVILGQPNVTEKASIILVIVVGLCCLAMGIIGIILWVDGREVYWVRE